MSIEHQFCKEMGWTYKDLDEEFERDPYRLAVGLAQFQMGIDARDYQEAKMKRQMKRRSRKRGGRR